MENTKCNDNRFEVIEKAKKHLLEATNIEGSKDEMACLDSFLFRCWQMGWLNQYDDTCRETRIENQLGLMLDVMRSATKSLNDLSEDFHKTLNYVDRSHAKILVDNTR